MLSRGQAPLSMGDGVSVDSASTKMHEAKKLKIKKAKSRPAMNTKIKLQRKSMCKQTEMKMQDY